MKSCLLIRFLVITSAALANAQGNPQENEIGVLRKISQDVLTNSSSVKKFLKDHGLTFAAIPESLSYIESDLDGDQYKDVIIAIKSQDSGLGVSLVIWKGMPNGSLVWERLCPKVVGNNPLDNGYFEAIQMSKMKQLTVVTSGSGAMGLRFSTFYEWYDGELYVVKIVDTKNKVTFPLSRGIKKQDYKTKLESLQCIK
jgi:hypothetical protein